MFNLKRIFQTKTQKELSGKLTDSDDAWHNGFYPYLSDKQYKFDEAVVGQKYILVECQPTISSGVTLYKSVVLMDKWRTKFLWFTPGHIRCKSTWNGRVDEGTMPWHGGSHLFAWRDIDKDRKKK